MTQTDTTYKTETTAKTESSVVVRRTFPYSQDKLWAAWTQPEALKSWFHPGPELETPIAEVDLQVNGRYHMEVHNSHIHGVYKAVEPPHKLVFTWYWQDHEDMTTLVTVEFLAQGTAETEVVLTHERFANTEERDNHEGGWYGCLEELSSYLEE
jgi:uncharacterized protein YndB with AHSA1/START domain